MKNWFKNIDSNLIRLLVITMIVFIIMAALVPSKFLTMRNIESMSFQFPELGLLSIAIMITMLTGGIDLSVVGIANLSGIFMALIFTKVIPEGTSGFPMFLYIIMGIIVGVSTGAFAGYLNGLLIAKVGITPILATLGTMQLFTGMAVVITKGFAISGFPEAFLIIGNSKILFVSFPLFIFILTTAGISILLSKTSLGINLYLIGTNEKAAVFSGIKKSQVLIKSYMLSGILGGITGVIMIARTNSAKADYGSSYVLQAILVSVLGGVNPAGGFGKVIGVVIAVLALQFLSSGFSMLRFSNFAKEFIWGAFLLFIMVLNFVQNRKAAKNIVKKEDSK